MQNYSIRVGGQLIDLTNPVVMGILNATPDSFAVHSESLMEADVKKYAEKLLSEGAEMIDIGGYSTRPGAKDVSLEEEWQRVEIALKVIRENWPETIVSVDTWRTEVARRAIKYYGDIIINDVSGGAWDEGIFELAARARVPYILMHTGWKSIRQEWLPRRYEDILAEVLAFLQEKTDELHQMGVADVILDPGYGFGKTLEENYRLLNHLDLFQTIDCPILAGLSRKSMFFKPLQITPQEALPATIAANMIALERGAKILRVHDVKAAKDTIKVYQLTHSQE